MSKKCNRCGDVKDFNSFYKNKDSPDGYYSICKQCKNKYSKKRYESILQSTKQIPKTRVCPNCGLEKNSNCFYRVNSSISGLYTYCKSCSKKIGKKYYNKDYYNEYYKQKRREDKLFNLKERISSSIRQYMRIKSDSTHEIVGLDSLALIEWLNKTNKLHSFGDKNVHIDHVIPCSYAENDYEVKLLNHYSNLQLMGANENQSKSNKYIKSSSLDRVISNHINPLQIIFIASRCENII